jgi:signal-transduction protein with cAMP-binding, CBS, and nucleotidyltransferase domain
MRARDVMTAHPSVVTPDETIFKAAQVMRDRKIGLLLVIDNLQSRQLLGVLTDRDVVIRCVAAGHDASCAVREHMTSSHLTSVHLDDDVGLVAVKMMRDHVRRIPVLAEGGRAAGVVALADLATRLRPSDPSLVERIERQTSSVDAHTH